MGTYAVIDMGTYEIPAGMSIAATARYGKKDSRNHAKRNRVSTDVQGRKVEFSKTDETVEQPEALELSRGPSDKIGFSFSTIHFCGGNYKTHSICEGI